MAKLLQKANPTLRQTAQELKVNFIRDAAPLVQQYVDAAIGTGTLKGNNAGARQEVWDLLKSLMLQSSDKLDIDIKSAEDVLEAVSTGKCTFEEGDKLLKLYKQVKEINTAGLMPGIGNQGGLHIHIEGTNAPTPIQEVPHQNEVIDHETK